MTPQEFCAKFGVKGPKADNSYLEDMACPECGYRGQFRISATADVLVSNYDVDDDSGFEWDRDSACACTKCDHQDIIAGFTIVGLDEHLSDLKEAKQCHS